MSNAKNDRIRVRKAVIPAAGLGTRMLPISRAVPKEMLPIVDKPAIAYLVEECAASGITDVLIITGRNKTAIEDYFDYSPEYEAAFVRKNKPEQIADLRAAAAPGGVRVYFMRQKETMGLGHAILCAENFIGSEPFSVLYGDDIVFSDGKPATLQLIDAYEKYGRSVCGVKPVPRNMLKKYCSLKAEPIKGGAENEYFCDDMIEKPQRDEDAFSNLSILGRVLLTPDIFDILKKTKPGAGGEIQLTDAIAVQAREHGVTALEFEGTRYDLGSKLGLMTANVVRAAQNEEIGEDFRAFLKDFASKL
ncbi:MAG: UTP--glucose-1-phosphate uridylyltransferase [Clostridia bacterium]|nr:UTP--glucose-1-phosphate uridylyltransferase [Clostridia bacterium]